MFFMDQNDSFVQNLEPGKTFWKNDRNNGPKLKF